MAAKVPKKLVQKRSFSQQVLMFVLGINRDLALQVFFSLLIILATAGIFHFQFLSRAENIFLDLFLRWSPAKAVDHVISVDIQEDALVAIPERPIPLNYYAELTRILKQWGARAVVFGFVLEGQPDSAGYLELQKAIASNKNVYLPILAGKSAGRDILVRSPVEIESRARGVGHIRMTPDQDGIIRRFEPFIEADGRFYPHLGLKLVYDTLGRKLDSVADLWAVPNEDGMLMIPWAGKWQKSFKHYSFMDVLKSDARLAKKERPFVQPGDFKDKVCLVGFSGLAAKTAYATPLDNSVPRMAVVAAVINGALLNDFIRPEQHQIRLAYLVAFGVAAIFFFTPFRTLFSLTAFLGLALGWLVFSFFMLSVKEIWIFVFHPLLLLGLLFIFSVLFSKSVSDRERNVFYQLSTTDGLTGAAVRRYFDLMFQRAFQTAKRFHLPLSVILMDIDHFKKFNDTYGHQAGDEVLRKVASLIRKGIRFNGKRHNGDMLARYGGEEFVILLPNTDLKTATFNIAERIRKAIESIPVEWEGQQLKVTMSLGVASVHDFDQKPELVVKRADDALYRSKENGRNQTSIETFDDSEAS